MQKFDCLVIGCGAAGLSAGIEYMENSSEDDECIVIGSQLTNSSLSPWNMRKTDTETIERKMREGGDGLGDEKLRNTYLDNYSDCKRFMENVGLDFEESNLGIIPENEETALRKFHSYYRDELNGKLEDRKVKNLLLNDEGLIIGVRTEDEDIVAENIVLAAGGMTNLFEYSSGFKSEGLASILALSLDAGLKLDNLEFMMYHPFLVVDDSLPTALISGNILQNARFLNEEGDEFLSDEIQDALRNNNHHNKFSQMTREFYRESQKSDLSVNISEISEERFEEFKEENEYGWVFRGKDLKEVEEFKINPTFHYSLGGLVTDENAETSQENVFAAGEIATGLHGSNRIGGTAIPEAVIFGRIAGENAAQNSSSRDLEVSGVAGDSEVSEDLRERFWDYLGPVKKRSEVEALVSNLEHEEDLSSEEKLLLKTGKSVLEREENTGSHYLEERTMSDKYVIIGDGIAGATAAEKIREKDEDAEIRVFTDESEPLYNRIMLKNYMKGSLPKQYTRVHDEGWYESRDIDLQLETRVADVDEEKKTVETENGETFEYDTLLVAAGGSPREFPADEDYGNLHYMWTIQKAEEIKEAAEESEEAVVIGGGLLGIDLAVAFAENDAETHYLIRGSNWWSRGLDEEGASIIHERLEELGVNVITDTEASNFIEEDGEISKVVSKDGEEFSCDNVAVAIGQTPNSGILDVEKTDGGLIQVDEHLQTSDDNIYAAGNMVEYYSPVFEERTVKGSWDHSDAMGERAGKNMRGEDETFDYVNTYGVGHFKTQFLAIGDWTGEPVSKKYDDDHYRRLYFKEDRLVGAVMIGYTRGQEKIKELIKEKEEFEDKEALLEKSYWE